MADRSVIENIKKYLNTISQSGIPVSFGVLFGSFASGSANRFSDIDLLVVSPIFDGIVPRDVLNKLWHLAAKIDSRIEPIPCGEVQWQDDDSNPIIEIARLEGQSVSAA